MGTGDCDGNVLDECGVCGGDGIAEGACDCDGTLPADGYDCAGVCLNDTDGDGTCDEFEIAGCTDQMAATMMLQQQMMMALVQNWTSAEFAAVTASRKALAIAMVPCLPTVTIALAFV